ncbi:MAG: phytanoyl-CoA dioxygenase family protein [Patescibacteria group bacterium]
MIGFIKSLVKKLYTYPPRFAGGFISNLLGYHILRVLVFNTFYGLRGKKFLQDKQGKAIYEKIMADGIAVIPNFFPEEVFLQIKNECDKAKKEIMNERSPYMARAALVRDDKKDSNFILDKHLASNSFINEIVSAVLGKDILVKPKVSFEETFYHKEDIGKRAVDTQDQVHFDVSYPTVKCLYYLNDIDDSNAAFEYARGSQKLTLKRLWMEYKMSIAFGRWSRNRQGEEPMEVEREALERQGMKVIPFTGKANTLVIANTMGFHRRGTHKTTKPRHLIFVDYRELETFKFLKRKLLQ